MDYLDDYDESRPRIVFQSRAKPSSNAIDSPQNSLKNKPLLLTSFTFSLIFLVSSFFFLQSQLLNSLFLWLSISLLVGPFAPLSLTCGDFRVGQGKIVDFPPQIEQSDVDESKKKLPSKRNKGKRSDLSDSNSIGSFDFVKNSDNLASSEGSGFGHKKIDGVFLSNVGNVDGGDSIVEEREWNEEDIGLLRKLIVKNPVGKPRRWDVISEGFKGRHSVESVINKAKGLGKEKPDDSDAYSKFLKDRKPVDKRADGGNDDRVGKESGGGGEVVSAWTSGEDIALLNALKTFPKEVAMRWEKIAAAVPGKTKAACMKRVGDLKKEFRSSKTSGES